MEKDATPKGRKEGRFDTDREIIISAVPCITINNYVATTKAI